MGHKVGNLGLAATEGGANPARDQSSQERIAKVILLCRCGIACTEFGSTLILFRRETCHPCIFKQIYMTVSRLQGKGSHTTDFLVPHIPTQSAGMDAWGEWAIMRSKPPPIVSLSIATPCIIPSWMGIISLLCSLLHSFSFHEKKKKKPRERQVWIPVFHLGPWSIVTIRNSQRHSTPSDPSGFKLWIHSGLSRGERYLRLSWHKSDTGRLLRLIPHTTVCGTVGQSPWPKLLLHDQQEVDATSPVQRSQPRQAPFNSS